MKIAIAARGLTQGFSGPNEFIRGLARGFLAHLPHVELHMYYDSPVARGLFPAAREHVLPSANRLVWDQALLPRALKRDKIDIAIFPKGPLPFILPCRAISVIHDLGYFHPEINAYRAPDTKYFQFALPRAVRRADAVFAVSEYTRQDVIRTLGADPLKVLTVYEAPGEGYRPVVDEIQLNAVRAKYNLKEPFIFYPTSISPRKNILRVLEAFEPLTYMFPYRLYLTGGMGWNNEAIKEKLSAVSHRVKLLGAVDAADMPAIYSLAKFTIYPSLFEGFGLPLVEAFLCGSPVLTSDQTCLPEIAGDASLIVDGLSVTAIRDGLIRMLRDAALRESLRQKGFERARVFTWVRTMRIIAGWLEKNQ